VSEPEPIALNDAQRRAVGATLRQVERCVEEIERLLAGPAAGITFQFVADLDATERQEVARACEGVRRILVPARRDLGVEVVTRPWRREIRGAASIAWATVEDSKSEALRGYGPLVPEAGAAVDQLFDQVAQGLVGVLRLLDHRSSKSQRARAHLAGM